MTEQPAETEQDWLGNLATAGDPGPLPEVPLQHYAPNAHRLPLWSPVDDVEVTALIRKSINANKLLAIAKAEAIKAETALQLALEVEDQASAAAAAAQNAIVAFTRKDTGL